MQNSNRQIKIGAVISYITIAFSIISGLIYTPWMISKIGQSSFGLYTLTISLITLVTMDLGLSQSVSRFLSKYRAENDKESIRKFLGITYKLFIFLALIFLISLTIVFFNVDNIFDKLTSDEIGKVKVLLMISGLYAVISFPFNPLDGILISGEKFIFFKTLSLISRVLNIVLMVIALLLGYGLYSLVIVNAISGLTIIILKLHYLRKKDPQEIDWKCKDKKLTKSIFSFSIWVMVISIAQRLILNITPSILGMTSGSKEIAIMSIAITLEGYVWLFSSVFLDMFLPKVSQIIYRDKAGAKEIQALMIKVGRIQFILLAAIISIFISAGKDFILNWVGYDFEKSYIVALFLIIPGLLTVPQSIASTTLVAINKVKYNALSRIVVAVLSISLSYFLSINYGSIGSGIGIFIGNIIGSVILMNIIYKIVLKINIWEFFKSCQLKMILPFIIVILTGIVLNKFLIDISWHTTAIKVIILVCLYLISAYFTALNKYEKDLIRNTLNKIVNHGR